MHAYVCTIAVVSTATASVHSFKRRVIDVRHGLGNLMGVCVRDESGNRSGNTRCGWRRRAWSRAWRRRTWTNLLMPRRSESRYCYTHNSVRCLSSGARAAGYVCISRQLKRRTNIKILVCRSSAPADRGGVFDSSRSSNYAAACVLSACLSIY